MVKSVRKAPVPEQVCTRVDEAGIVQGQTEQTNLRFYGMANGN